MPSYRRPREAFGFSAFPLPGDESPLLSTTTAERFDRAGLSAFAPYIDPYATLAKARDYRNFERDMGREEQVQMAEDQFLQAIQQDPKTGYQRFLAENPLATLSPMIRTYAMTQDRLRQAPKEDKFAVEAAGYGAPYLAEYQKSRAGGKSELEAFSEAVSKRQSDLANVKKKPEQPWQQRLSDKERETVREIARATKGLDDFETEFANVQKDNPSITKDQYVKQFKGDPDFQTYKQRRLGEQAQVLVDEYGLADEEASQLLGLGSQARPAASSALRAPLTPETAQSSPQAIPLPMQVAPASALNPPAEQAPARTTEFNFPTLGDDLPPTGFESAVQAGDMAIGNVASNVAFDPLGSVAKAMSPGGLAAMAVQPAPTSEEQNKAWTDAKQTVRDYIEKLPGDEAQKLKMLGSILAEQDVPMDSFFPKKIGTNERIHSGMAFESGLRLFGNKRDLPEHALKDKEGNRRWTEVAKVVAQEELAKKGLIQTPESQPKTQSTKTPNIKAITKIQ